MLMLIKREEWNPLWFNTWWTLWTQINLSDLVQLSHWPDSCWVFNSTLTRLTWAVSGFGGVFNLRHSTHLRLWCFQFCLNLLIWGLFAGAVVFELLAFSQKTTVAETCYFSSVSQFYLKFCLNTSKITM